MLFTSFKRLFRFVFVMVALVAVLTTALVVMAPRVVDLVSAHRSDHEHLSLKPLAERSKIFDSRGNDLGTLINSDNQNRVQVKLDKVPATVVQSVLAAEDANFYKHSGVNIRSIFRALDAGISSGEGTQGASTITQQVVKNSLTGNAHNLSRKLREAFLSVELEKQFGSNKKEAKDKILERYLNSVYFGGGAYGVAAASEYYFNKDIGTLNWAEGAMLAALIRSPNAYDPFSHPATALARRKIVFKRLVETGKLTAAEVKLYSAVPLPTTPNNPSPPNDYFVEQVKQQLLDDPSFGLGATAAARNQTVFSGGIKVFTTFDPVAQVEATEARNATLPKNNGDGTFTVQKPNGQITYGTQAIASIEPQTGAVRVLVGGPGYQRDPSRADLTGKPGRQPGSSMKVFTLATLLENGYVPDDTVNGGSCTFKVPGQTKLYHPATDALGVATITSMIQHSSNCGFLRLAQLVGNDKIVDMAHRLGVRTSLNVENPCPNGEAVCPPFNLTLGVEDVPVIDMAAAYSVFANDGVQNKPYFVERIEDRNGKVIYQHQADPVQVLKPQVARLVDQVLVNNVQRGTGTNARLASGQPAAGKTGTTNESTDVWFVGYTPQLATAIWMGAPGSATSLNYAGLAGATGGRFPALTWGHFYDSYLAGQPIVDFPEPDPTRKGHFLGKIPNEVGGISSGSTKPRRTYPTGPGTGTGTGTGTGGGTVTTTPTATVGTTTPGPGFGGGTGTP